MDKKKIGLIVLPLLIFCSACASSNEKDVPFKYGAILQKNFGELGDGREIPVTIENATEIDGSVTADGQYLFFSSDRERGNFDIYLRSLTDITTVRITAHPSKDTAPAVSQDGRYIAFVSTREDPQGDIYVTKVDPKKMVKEYSSEPGKNYDDDSKNISALTDQVSRAPLSVKDSDPSWSPDGRSIVFSSTREGSENLWVCSRKGKDLRQLTFKGGIQPRFSQDGSLVAFVSYRDNPQGDIYTVEIASGKETRVTSSAGLKLYPSFCSTNDDLIFTLIDKDTNGDSIVDFKDMSALVRNNSAMKNSYFLTKYSSSAFRGRWFPVFPLKYLSSQEDNFKGVIFYSAQTEGNININVIPEYGIIPKRKYANDQLSLAESYLRDEGDSEKYIMALLRVYFYFGDRKDNDSAVAVSRALYRAAAESFSRKDLSGARSIRAMLESFSKKSNDFSTITASSLDNLFAGRDPFSAYEQVLKNGTKDLALMPYFLDDAASIAASSGKTSKAIIIYERILNEFPSYKKASAVNYALATLTTAGNNGKISPYYLEVIKKGEPFQKDRTAVDIISLFMQEKDPSRRIVMVSKLYPAEAPKAQKSPQDTAVAALLDYITGAAYAEKGDSAAATEYLLKALSKLRTTELLYYESNILLGTLAGRKGDSVSEEKYLFSAATSYINRWNRPGFTPVVMKLVDYYERTGSDLEYAGDFRKASELYQRYVKLVTYLHWLRKFEVIYNEYGARAHVLYIDACENKPGEPAEKLNALQLEYSKEKLDIARLNYDKAEIYGLAYIYAKMGIELDRRKRILNLDVSEKSIVETFGQSCSQIDWALFMDDTFADPYLLQGWINQYVDLRRDELTNANSFSDADKYDEVFSRYLWERNKSVYQKALDVNEEGRFPDKEGSLHLNLANTQFLLGNYPSALDHYQLAAKYKKNFGSKKEEALFRYHFGYCLWQNGEVKEARNEILRVLNIYGSANGSREYARQRITLYRYLALFERSEKNYSEALKWYSTLINESGRYRIKIDASRIYIDSAWCWEQLGDDVRAVSYLNRAKGLLSKMDDNDPVFKLQVRPFGLFSFHIYNLGPDKVVIGDTRLFGALSVAQQKLLLEASLERIAIKRGEYAKAREHIVRRLEILKNRDNAVDADMKIRALNSDGYCLFMIGKYSEAKDRFNEALSFASDESVNNQEGIFASIQNLVDLYADACERNLSILKNPEKDLRDLKLRITKFETDYEKVEFEKAKSSLESAAKEKETQVRQEDLDAAKVKIAAEAASIYTDLDISAAIIDFYSAEFLSAKNLPADAQGVYRSQDSLFRIYLSAASVFEDKAASAVMTPQKKAKLLLNAAECCKKAGMAEKAYELYGRAEKTCGDAGRDDVLWKVLYREALFMRDCGSSIDEDYLRISDQLFGSACEIIEKAPALYSRNAAAVSSLYKDRAILISRRGDFASSIRILEKGYAVERVIMTALEPPSFDGVYAADWNTYEDLLSSIREALRVKSDLLSSGSRISDHTVTAADGVIQNLYSRLNSFGKDLDRRNPLLSSMFFVRFELPKKNSLNGLPVYSFLTDKNQTYAWRLTGEKIESAVLKGSGDELVSSIKTFITADARSLIVLNDSSECLFGHSAGLPPFTFIPSADRAVFFTGKANVAYGKTVSSSASLKDLAAADILVESRNNSLRSIFLSHSSEPSVSVAAYTELRAARSIVESALWTGCRTVIFSVGQKSISKREDFAAIASDLSGINTSDAGFIAAGADGIIAAPSSLVSQRDKEKDASREFLAKGKVSEALLHFAKYQSMIGGKLSSEDDYILARIYDLSGDGASALSHARIAAADRIAEHLSFAVYLLLLNGDCAGASVLLSSFSGDAMFAGSADRALYDLILSSAKEGSAVKMPEGRSILAKDKLLLLASRYALISESAPIRADLSASASRADQYMSAFSGASVSNADAEVASFLSIFTQHTENQYEKALAASASEGSDSLSLYPLLFALKDGDSRYGDDASFLGSIVPETAASKGVRTDRLIFLLKFKEACRRASLHDQYSKAMVLLELELADAGMLFKMHEVQIERARNLSSASQYKEAYSVLKKLSGSSLSPSQAVRTALLSAECEIFTGDIKNGTARLEVLSTGTAGLTATKELLLAHAERILIIKNPVYAVEGFPRYETHMKKVVSLLDRSLFESADMPRKDLLDKGLEFISAFSMRKNDTRSALMYAEIKQQTEYWRITSGQKTALSKDDADAYSSAKDAPSYWAALAHHPALADEKRILFPAIEAFQRKLPYGSMAVVVVKNEEDILFWTIERESIQPYRADGGYAKARELIRRYEDALRDMSPVSAISAELESLIAPAFRGSDGRRIYLMTDEYTEKIPFEISGSSHMLGRKGRIAYLPSLSGSLSSGTSISAKCVVVGSSELDAAAVRESGIAAGDQPGGVIHFSHALKAERAGLSSAGKPVRDRIKDKALVWISGNSPYDSTLFFVQELLSGYHSAAVINGTADGEISGSYFASVLYERLAAGDSLSDAYAAAAVKVSGSQNYSHPAFWAGIRLYLKALPEQ